MPTATTSAPIHPATYSVYAPAPDSLSPGLVKRARRVAGRARQIIEAQGWAQNASINDDGGRCLTAALSEARNVKSKAGLVPLTSAEMGKAVLGVLEQARPSVTRRARPFSNEWALQSWNDRHNRTQEQVVALLRKAEEG